MSTRDLLTAKREEADHLRELAEKVRKLPETERTLDWYADIDHRLSEVQAAIAEIEDALATA